MIKKKKIKQRRMALDNEKKIMKIKLRQLKKINKNSFQKDFPQNKG